MIIDSPPEQLVDGPCEIGIMNQDSKASFERSPRLGNSILNTPRVQPIPCDKNETNEEVMFADESMDGDQIID